MRIWSTQPNSVALAVESGERFVCDPALAVCYNWDDYFQRAYHWLVGEMDSRMERPAGLQLPVWGWHRTYGEAKKPDRRKELFAGYDENDVILELEIPDELVLLSDFDEWHHVLNDFPILSEEEWEADPDREYSDEEKRATWPQIFNITDEKRYIQACFWSIEPEYLVKVHRLRRRK